MTDNVTDLPVNRVPRPYNVEFLDKIELALFRALAEMLDFGKNERLHHACGLAEARYFYLWNHVENPDPWPVYIATVTTALRRLSVRQREKLRHPALDRAGAQTILDGG